MNEATKLDLQSVVLGTLAKANQMGYVAHATSFRTASPAVVVDGLEMLRRGAENDSEIFQGVARFKELYYGWLTDQGRMGELPDSEIAKYF